MSPLLCCGFFSTANMPLFRDRPQHYNGQSEIARQSLFNKFRHWLYFRRGAEPATSWNPGDFPLGRDISRPPRGARKPLSFDNYAQSWRCFLQIQSQFLRIHKFQLPYPMAGEIKIESALPHPITNSYIGSPLLLRNLIICIRISTPHRPLCFHPCTHLREDNPELHLVSLGILNKWRIQYFLAILPIPTILDIGTTPNIAYNKTSL